MRRALPLLVVAIGAFAAGAVVGRPGNADRQTVSRYMRAWSAGDYGAMYGLLGPASQRAMSERSFARALRRSARTATLVSLRPLRIERRHGDLFPVPVAVTT